MRVWLHKIGLLATPDIPFARDDANRFLPWIVGFMLCLTALVLALSVSLSASLFKWDGDYVNRFTVQLPHMDDGRTEAVTEAILALSKQYDWIENARQLPQNEMQQLIEPWLGDNKQALDSLPLPSVVEVTVKEDVKPDIKGFTERAKAISPAAEVDDFKLWMAKFRAFASTARWMALGFASLFVVVSLAIVILAAKTTLRLHHSTVRLLYTIGAEDDYIARQFQYNSMRLVGKAALIGTGVAILLFMMLSSFAKGINAPLLPSLNVTFSHIVLFVLLPFLASMAALATTRFAVLSFLRRQI